MNVGNTAQSLCSEIQRVNQLILVFLVVFMGHPGLLIVEDKIGKPLFAYAASKAAIEQYTEVFGHT